MRISQNFWPDIELFVTDGDDAGGQRIRGHRCLLATLFEWFRAWLQHPSTIPNETLTDCGIQVYRINTDGLPFGPNDVKAMIEHAYGTLRWDAKETELERFLAANVYFGRTDKWLERTLWGMIENKELDQKGTQKETYRIIRALLRVQGLGPPELVRAFLERYVGLLPSELVAKLPPFISLESISHQPIDPFTGQPPRLIRANHDGKERTVLVLEGTVSDTVYPVIQWNGLEYTAYPTVHENEIGVWLTCRPIDEELSVVHDPEDETSGILVGTIIDSPRHCVQVRLRLFHGLHYFGPAEFLELATIFDHPPTLPLQKWVKGQSTHQVMPLRIVYDLMQDLAFHGPSYNQPARERIGRIVRIDHRAQDFRSVAYRLEVIVHDVVMVRQE